MSCYGGSPLAALDFTICPTAAVNNRPKAHAAFTIYELEFVLHCTQQSSFADILPVNEWLQLLPVLVACMAKVQNLHANIASTCS
jgi:hypothetical protein